MTHRIPILLALVACAPDEAPPPDGGDPTGVTDPPAWVAGWCPEADLDAVDAEIDALLGELTLDEKVAWTAGRAVLFGPRGTWRAGGDEARGLPTFHMVDGPRGVHEATGPATAFPVAVARGATWDPDLERRVGEAIAREAEAKGANVLLAPTINVLRHPRWGRAQETYGEDPVHLGAMGTAFVEGAQAILPVTAKHLAANSIEDTRFDVDVTVPDAVLRETYLPAFRRVVEEGRVASIMAAYNSVNGAFAAENAPLLNEVLKEDWGFPGFVVSDWVFSQHTTVAAANAGLDLEMPAPKAFGPDLGDAVRNGDVEEAVVDGMIRRQLRVSRCWDLDDAEPADTSAVGSPEHVALAREVAERSVVLLRNTAADAPWGHTLPLPADGWIVTGDLADQVNVGDEGSSDVEPTDAPLIADVLGRDRYRDAATFLAADTPEATAVVVVVGLTSDDEGEGWIGAGDRESLRLSEDDEALIAHAVATYDAAVVVLQGGGAVLVEDWLDDAAAVLATWYPGQEGAEALRRVLVGEVAPTGRLPVSFPRAEEDLPPFDNTSLEVAYGPLHGYRHLEATETTARFPFGFGLSYGTVVWAPGVTLEAPPQPTPDDVVTVSVRLTAEDDQAPFETVQAYVTRPLVPGVQRPRTVLGGFTTAPLVQGEETEVTVHIALRDVARWDEAARRWVLDAGTYEVVVGRHAEDDRAVRTAFVVP